MSQAVWRFAGFSIDGTFIPMTSRSLDPGIEAFANGGGESLFNTFTGVNTSKPIASVSSMAVAAVLAGVGISGIKVTSAAPVIMYFLKMDELGIASGSVHKSVTVNSGVLFISAIGAGGAAEATVGLQLLVAYDGINIPLIIAEDIAAPNITPLSETFFLGPVSIGSTLYETNSWSYDANWTPKHDTHSGNTYPTFAGLRKGAPTFTIESGDANLFADALHTGSQVTTTKFYLRKGKVDGTGREEDVSTVHINMSVAEGLLAPTAQAGTAFEESTHGFLLTPNYDETNLPVTIVSNSAIAA